jgi:hypothetical protein
MWKSIDPRLICTAKCRISGWEVPAAKVLAQIEASSLKAKEN